VGVKQLENWFYAFQVKKRFLYLCARSKGYIFKELHYIVDNSLFF